ncbi:MULTISPECIES: response regulator [Paraburkholderia]|uniref:Response regulator n=1 Tax=Paraburkholderia acidicola TaxID=1912599 RepID=A0ABV1LYW2_9BURK
MSGTGGKGDRGETPKTQFDDVSHDTSASDDVVVLRPITQALTGHRRVLVVDDYRDAAEALQLLLYADGFECRALDDPREVCAVAEAWQPFAVVLDIAMPGLDGLQLARRLRAGSATGHMLLVACTALASTSDRRRAKEAGFDAHCAKPLTPRRLLHLFATATMGVSGCPP